MKYIITIARTEYRSHDFAVDATSQEGAELLAKELAYNNTDWALCDVEEFVNDTRLIKG